MIGLLLVLASTFFEEISESVTKVKVRSQEENLYTMGFLAVFWATIMFASVAALRPASFVFSFASLPTFIPRVLLEFVQIHIFLLAVTRADRSTFGFLRVLTLPALLGVDIVLGYTITLAEMLGIAVIVLALVVLFMNKGIRKKGIGYVFYTAFGAVVTLTLFKYDITHFNSVVAEQLIVHIALLAYFTVMALVRKHQFPLFALRKPALFFQSLSFGFASLLGSFAYAYAPASVITSGKRSGAILWSIVAGRKVFHEDNVVVKLLLFVVLSVGIALLAF